MKMILAEKIMNLRKKNGWSQEELAAKLNVSRQSVSKWESAISVPELDKILQMSQIFEVSTDYLLKDENVEEDYVPALVSDDKPLRRVSMEEAREFISVQQDAAKKIGIGTVMCIVSPIVLMGLLGMSESGIYGVSETLALTVGLTILLLVAAGAVAIFILQSIRLEKYKYFEEEKFDLEYGVAGLAKERKEAEGPAFARKIAVGVVLCIIGTVLLVVASVMTEDEFIILMWTNFLLLVVACAVYLFITAAMSKSAYEKILQEGEYTDKNKKLNQLIGKIGAVYWPLVIAGYMWWSFYTMNWAFSWIVWPVAGILFGAVVGICRILQKD